jgi:hypothetical protein
MEISATNCCQNFFVVVWKVNISTEFSLLTNYGCCSAPQISCSQRKQKTSHLFLIKKKEESFEHSTNKKLVLKCEKNCFEIRVFTHNKTILLSHLQNLLLFFRWCSQKTFGGVKNYLFLFSSPKKAQKVFVPSYLRKYFFYLNVFLRKIFFCFSGGVVKSKNKKHKKKKYEFCAVYVCVCKKLYIKFICFC